MLARLLNQNGIFARKDLLLTYIYNQTGEDIGKHGNEYCCRLSSILLFSFPQCISHGFPKANKPKQMQAIPIWQ